MQPIMNLDKQMNLLNELNTTYDKKREYQIMNQFNSNAIRIKKEVDNNLHQLIKLEKKSTRKKNRKNDKENPILENVKQDIINVNKKNKNFIVTNRVAFKKILKNTKIETGESFMDILDDAISRTNKIVFHTYNFIKLYFIDLVDTAKSFPAITREFIRTVMNTITCKNQTRGKNPKNNDSTKKIKRFYNDHYRPLLNEDDIICRDDLKHILNYEETDIITNISNNVQCHYIKHLENYIWKYCKFSEKIQIVRENKTISKEDKKNQISKIKETFKNVVNDILDVSQNEYVSKEMYHKNISRWKQLFIPNKQVFKKNKTTEDKNIVRYDIVCKPLDYLKNMIILSKKYEMLNDKIIEKHDDTKSTYPKTLKLFNALPLRTSIVPSSITLDTTGMISLFIHTGAADLLSKVSKHGKKVFGRFFKLNSKPFKRKDYIFNNMIRTDGISCSINLIKQENGKRPTKKTSFEIKKLQPTNEVKYIHEVKVIDKMKKKEIVTLDPGKKDIISCMKKNNKQMILTTAQKKKSDFALRNHLKHIHYTYTVGKRNVDVKKKKYRLIRENLSKMIIHNRESVKDIENKLLEVNSKTSNLEKFKEYIIAKIKANNLLYDHYNNPLFRKLNWNTYINMKRSESNMINNFRKIMGPPKKVIVVVGDYSDMGLRGTEPAITKKIRKIFKNHGYNTYLIDEYRTSITCSRKNCYGYCEPFIKTGENKYLWKVLRCEKCKTIHNRDHNATKNMMKIVENHFEGKSRPSAMTRPEKDKKIIPTKITPNSKTNKCNKKKKKPINKSSKKSISLDNTTSTKQITKSQSSKSTISGRTVINTSDNIKRNTDNITSENRIKLTNDNILKNITRGKPVNDTRKIIDI